MNFLQRWRYKLAFISMHAESINRRVEVENVLAAVASGKRDLLTRDECRQLARKLGVPERAGRGGAK